MSKNLILFPGTENAGENSSTHQHPENLTYSGHKAEVKSDPLIKDIFDEFADRTLPFKEDFAADALLPGFYYTRIPGYDRSDKKALHKMYDELPEFADYIKISSDLSRKYEQWQVEIIFRKLYSILFSDEWAEQ